jgi:phosphohistidine phosphatase
VYLYILQHGDAEPASVDPERPLSAIGVRDIENMATRLHGMQVQPAYIFHSGKQRARQTAQIISQQIAPELEPVQTDGLAPNDDPAIIIEDIIRLDQEILIVSHMPFVSRLCSDLLSGGAGCTFGSVPGTVMCLQSGPQGWQMQWMLRPECL